MIYWSLRLNKKLRSSSAEIRREGDKQHMHSILETKQKKRKD